MSDEDLYRYNYKYLNVNQCIKLQSALHNNEQFSFFSAEIHKKKKKKNREIKALHADG